MGKKRGGPKRDRDAGATTAYRDFASVEKTSEAMERYYALQGILPAEELQQMFTSFREPLPTTFRITGSRATMDELKHSIKSEYVPFLTGVIFESRKAEPPAQIPWYPDGLAWQVNVEKRLIRKSPEFKKFQSFLVYETEVGNISRQEAVSMIPPLFMDIQSHHAILDCCAAPGSKSGQILEALHMAHPDNRPTGVFVANDADIKRCHMLVHQSLRRLGSPNMMVTNNDASLFPTLKRQSATGAGPPDNIMFDRILADVPCSGDGTMRKNLAIWQNWTLGNGLGLHSLQLRILNRCIQMLKPGGRLVYSTCSLNPYENEAVVNAALNSSTNMSLVDVSDQIPALQRYPGKTTWKVLDTIFNEVEAPPAGEKAVLVDGRRMFASLWPTNTQDNKLERCMRVYPHMQNTGGFFIAVLEKAGSKESEPASDAPGIVEPLEAAEPDVVPERTPVGGSANNSDVEEGPPRKKVKVETVTALPDDLAPVEPATGKPFKEDPYTFLSADDPEVKTCLDFFKMDPAFDATNLMVRSVSGLPLRSMYATSASVRAIVSANNYKKIRLISCGTKVLAKQDSGKNETYRCKWRALNDGLTLLHPFISRDKFVTGDMAAVKILLDEAYPALTKFSENLREQLERQELGSCLFEVIPEGTVEDRPRQRMVLPLWKAPNTLCLMVEKKEKSALSLRLFGVPADPAERIGEDVEEREGMDDQPTL